MHLDSPAGLFGQPNGYCLISCEHSRSKWMEEEENEEKDFLFFPKISLGELSSFQE